MTKYEKQQLEMNEARQRVSDMNFLCGREEFSRFMDLIRLRADALANEVLHDEMAVDEREKRRQYRMGLLSVLSAPSEIISVNSKLIDSADRRAGGGVPLSAV